jgi:DNA primase
VARIKESSVEAVKAAASIVELVGERTPLRRSGARFVARCPFHDERTPSFSVSPERGTYHCFGCGKGGDAITFVQETEQVDFVGAIEWLAERFNVPLEYEQASPEHDARRRRRDRLHALLDQAATFYERYLWEAQAAEAARGYLAGRGLGEDVCRLYRLGLAPGGNALARKAREKGYTAEELAASGLVNRRGNDYFSGRLLFPLADPRGRVVGFQARRLREDDPLKAKYVNSPEGELFRKGDLLYGLDKARAAIARLDQAVVVEGNPDVLAVRQAGFEPVVAAMGTALTERQLKELSRLTTRLFLCFDGDKAGEAATLRGMELAAAHGFEIRVVPLPRGKDPADVAEGFEAHLRDAVSYARHRVLLALAAGDTLEQKLRELRAVVAAFEEGSASWLEAVTVAADELQLSPEVVKSLRGYVVRGEGHVSPKVEQAGVKLERGVLSACVAHPELTPLLGELSPDHFDDDLHRRMRAELLGEAAPDDGLVALRAELNARAESDAIDLETGKELLLRLRARRLEQELRVAPLERVAELQAALKRVREAAGALV